jgi:pilus assembly protein FimV
MMSKQLPADRAAAQPRARHDSRWRAPVLTAVAASVLSIMLIVDAHALALGRISVQSSLGEPLRAEIDIPEINAEEAASLRLEIAPPAAFRASGFEYNNVLAGVQISLQRRADGRYVARLAGDRTINDPFLDVVLQASWSSGRVVRDYTLLFDPPSLRQPTAPQVLAPQIAPPPAPSATLPPAAPAGARAQVATATRPAARGPAPVAAAAPAEASRPATTSEQKHTVRAGDTAGKIAAANKPASISLDQMLVALLQANPDAFVGGNINRLKAGSVLDLPTAQQAGAITPEQARQTIVAQSRDFNDFRRRLGENAPVAQVAGADRQAAGRVQANVEDKKATAPTPDKLTLSKGSAQGKPGVEDKVAQSRQAQDANARVAELSKNINELAKLQAATGTKAPPTAAAPASPAPVASMPATPAVAVTATPAPAPAPVASAPAPAASAATAAAPVAAPAASAPPPVAAPAAPKPATPALAPAPEPSFVDELLDNPLIPAAAGGLLALLLGFGAYRYRQRRKSTQVDSSFLESRLQPDSFFGASGGQRVDTNEAAPSASSMVYSPSQLDAAGDVDPVAEADVYLAYGRDLQAEEILKEAMRSNPSRVAIHLKLLEIYAKRRDVKAFEVVAVEAYRLTSGHGDDWNKVSELGKELDPQNSLYQPGGQPSDSQGAQATQMLAAAASTVPQSAHPEFSNSTPAVDLDLDLDFSASEPGVLTTGPGALTPNSPQSFESEPTVAVQSFSNSQPAPLAMDFNIETMSARPSAPTEPAPLTVDVPVAEPPVPSLPELTETQPMPVMTGQAPGSDSGLIEFDLGSLSLDLGDNSAPNATASTVLAPLSGGVESASGDAHGLVTKLALAEEFNAIGDSDGARALIEEVVAEASGELKSRAQKLLAELR